MLVVGMLAALGALAPGRPAAAERSSAPPGPRRELAGQVALGGIHSCAIVQDGSVRCWGGNVYGHLGQGNTARVGDDETPAAVPPVDIGPGRRAVAVAAGADHTCVIRDDGQVMCWGYGFSGALGYGITGVIGDNETPASIGTVSLGPGRTAVDIAAGGAHTCAVLDNGDVRCWGSNTYGQLGNGLGTAAVGDDELPSSVPPVSLGAGRRAVAVAAGNQHTCVILDDGTVRCWGKGDQGTLGLPGFSANLGDNDVPSSQAVVSIGAGRRAAAITAGGAHTCVILDDGRVRCWGRNVEGQLGIASTATIGDDEAPSAGPLVSLPLSIPVVSGGVDAPEAAISILTPRAISLDAGNGHTCAVTNAGLVSCWGSGGGGQLGYGNTATVGDNETPASVGSVDLGSSRRGSVVAAGSGHTCVVRDDASLQCWGVGQVGELGYGSTANIGDDEKPSTVGAVSLGGPVAPTAAFSVAPSAEATSTGALVSWGAPTSLVTVSAITVRASTGQTRSVPADALSATFALPAGVPVSFTVELSTSAGTLSATTGTVVPGTNRFVPLSPARILDTRIGVGANAAIVPAQGEVALRVAGEGGVPDTGVTAVVMNVTVTEAAGPGFVTAYPSGGTRPLASNLNVERAGQTIPNLVTVAVGADGMVNLFTSNATHLIADVAGYYEVAPVAVAAGRFVPVDPARVLDTRLDAAGAIGTGEAREVTVAGLGGVPAAGAAAVVLNVTATEASAAGYLTVFPTGDTRPTVSNLNVGPGQTIANQVVVPIGSAGKVSIFAFARAHVIVDVAGWITDAAQPELFSGLLVPVSPTRLLDTRSSGKVSAGASATVVVTGLPAAPAAVVLNVTATEATGAGYVTAHPAATTVPLASNLNVERAGQTIPNHVVVRTGTGGNVSLFSQSGTHLVADLAGWYLA